MCCSETRIKKKSSLAEIHSQKGTDIFTVFSNGCGHSSLILYKMHTQIFLEVSYNVNNRSITQFYILTHHNQSVLGWVWWHMPLISALGRQKQMDLCVFEASLVYVVSSRPGKLIVRPLKNTTTTTTKQKKKKNQNPKSNTTT